MVDVPPRSPLHSPVAADCWSLRSSWGTALDRRELPPPSSHFLLRDSCDQSLSSLMQRPGPSIFISETLKGHPRTSSPRGVGCSPFHLHRSPISLPAQSCFPSPRLPNRPPAHKSPTQSLFQGAARGGRQASEVDFPYFEPEVLVKRTMKTRPQAARAVRRGYSFLLECSLREDP